MRLVVFVLPGRVKGFPILPERGIRDLYILECPQEYPEDPVTCFLTSGNSYFGDLTGAFTAPMQPVFDPSHEYAAGLDWGQTTDYSALVVLDKTTRTQVDILHINKLKWKEIRQRVVDMLFKWTSTRCDSGHVTQGKHDTCPECEIKKVSHKFPRFAAESNSIGSVNIEALMEQGLSIQSFETNNETKSDMMSGLYEAIHTNGWKLQDYPVLRHEMYNFVSKQLPSGVWRLAADGEGHDDTVMGLGIAHWVASVPIQVF